MLILLEMFSAFKPRFCVMKKFIRADEKKKKKKRKILYKIFSEHFSDLWNLAVVMVSRYKMETDHISQQYLATVSVPIPSCYSTFPNKL